MAGLAQLAQAPLVRFLVVLLVARPAVPRRGCIGLGLVAVLALDLLGVRVLAQQRKTRQAVVEPVLGRLPVGLQMALLAQVTLDAPVLVVLLVAADAGRLRLVLVQVDAGVAVVALCVLVLTAQRVLGVTVMVELDRLPVLVTVAVLALLAESAPVAFVVVILLVA